MILANYYKLLANYLGNDTKHQVTNLEGALKDSINTYDTLRFSYNNTYPTVPYIGNLLTSLSGNGEVILGSGTTAPTFNDYKLSGNMVTTFTYSRTVTTSKTDTGYNLTAVYTVTNTSDDAITIGEIGLIANGAVSSGSNNSSYKVLLERTVLDEPITIPGKGIGQVTYTINVEVPTA